ncbi:esterase/lipase [Cucurbitaria berberidis CBS 394.84]|uniref:Esterase/lipase n=1 Tax=Cucurbitaria berberidis CBS 394.84 TaxID=1168544 RepID=A0A9P4GMT6_9PLEO|nr:esterase/lipase [Cucurbitaria berberidis CBS 394.84]KAF1848324.1 esterase/lipase [Cucurbitaria berberidis CBS 394.84]
MASNPMQWCCVVGVKHDGTPKGQLKKIGDKNGSTQNAVLIMTDVIGMDFPNVQLIADQFATNGYFTVIPDVFNGNECPFPTPESFDLQEYFKTKIPGVPQVDPMYESVIKHLREELGVKRLGGVGHCFGGKYVCAYRIDFYFYRNVSFFKRYKCYQTREQSLTVCAETDFIFSTEKRCETEDILKEHTVPYQVFLYSDVEHGFGVKGDLSHAKARFAKEQAFMQAVHWFDEYVKKR